VVLGCSAGLLCSLALAVPAQAIDWTGVTERDIVVLYPGQASWEWSLTQDDHSGAKKFREGKDCRPATKAKKRKSAGRS
jgi:cytochrome c-type protein NapC